MIADEAHLPIRETGDAPERAAEPAASDGPLSPESDDFYHLLVDRVQDYAIFALDASGTILSWNRGAERLKGYQPNEIIGKHFSIFYDPAAIAAGKPARELVEAGRDGRMEDEGWRLRKDGSRFWANVVITALRDASGVLVGYAKVTRDLSERRLAEEELRQSEERFRMLVHSVRDYAIFMLDPDGYIASWNAGAERIKGYTSEEIIGQHFSKFYPVEDVRAGKTVMELEVATRTGKYEEEGWRVRKDGSTFWANVVITAVRSAEGTLVGFAKVTRDLTERRAADERAIADARRIAQVEAENRAKNEFLAAMSHELRTPINATLGYADLMAAGIEGDLSPTHREYLSRIASSQQHLLRIINDLLNYSRIAAGPIEYDLAPEPAMELINEVVPMISPQALGKNIRLVQVPCIGDPLVLVDRVKAEQIILNLLANAVKFTPAGGRVSISCEVAEGGVIITIDDTGPGIPLEHQSAIFEPFMQVGRSLISGHEGTGLGLAISRDLARGMNGEVSVQSTPGEGATFRLRLPAG